jgi:hypothetical protein
LSKGVQTLAARAPIFEHRPHVSQAACINSDHRSGIPEGHAGPSRLRRLEDIAVQQNALIRFRLRRKTKASRRKPAIPGYLRRMAQT